MTRKLSLFLLTSIAMVLGAKVCQAEPQSLLTRHVREVVLNGQAKLVGRLPATKIMRIDVVLPLRDQAGLENVLQKLYDPSSPSCRHYLTVQEFSERFGPSQADYDALLRFAKANSFTVVGGTRDAMDVQLRGSVATIEKALHLSMGVYQHPTEDRTFYAPDREPTVDLPFRLWHISGLDNYSIPRPALVRNPGKPEATTGSCPEASFCGSDMRAAYYEGTVLTGSGQNIGLLEFAGFDIADVNTYYQNAGQTRTAAVVGISTDGTSVTCLFSQGCDDTVQTIDITQSLGMAPGVTTAYLYVGSTDTALLGAMASDTPLPLNLSSSWSWTPADPQTDDPFFERMAVQGQIFFQSSGDTGAGKATWPSNSTYVIAVGGTVLVTQGAGGPWASETALGDAGAGWGTNVPIPWWQQLPGVITTADKGSTIYRNDSDVSANADFSFYVCADQAPCTANEFGGTSFGAPMWAGYLALANQQAAMTGDPPPGWIDPTIYPLGLGSGYNADFHDIISGGDGFPTTVGYDLPTGWGTPNGAGLINALLAPNFAITASPNMVTVSRGTSGKLTTITSTLVNGFNSAITLSSTIRGMTFSPDPIPAPGSGQSTVSARVPEDTKLGTYTITITGTGGGITNTTKVVVTVVQ